MLIFGMNIAIGFSIFLNSGAPAVSAKCTYNSLTCRTAAGVILRNESILMIYRNCFHRCDVMKFGTCSYIFFCLYIFWRFINLRIFQNKHEDGNTISYTALLRLTKHCKGNKIRLLKSVVMLVDFCHSLDEINIHYPLKGTLCPSYSHAII